MEYRRSHREQRITPRRFFRGLFRYLSQFPARVWIVIVGSGACLTVITILLFTIFPINKAGATVASLSIADITPTPFISPTATPVPTMEPTPSPDPLGGVSIQKVGENNDMIPAVQERLVTLGYMDMPAGGYTTKYGPATKIGVLLFQIKNFKDMLDWDGQLGPNTYAQLMSDTAKAYYLGIGDGDSRTKDITKLVADVKKLQERLISLGYMDITAASGYYGDSTAVAVKTFQQYHGLLQDGRAGQSTLAMLYSAEAMDAVTGKQNDRSKLPQTPVPSGDPALTLTPGQ